MYWSIKKYTIYHLYGMSLLLSYRNPLMPPLQNPRLIRCLWFLPISNLDQTLIISDSRYLLGDFSHFDDAFNHLFCHSSNITGSSKYEPTSDSIVLLSQFSMLSRAPLGLILVGGVGAVVVEVHILSAHTVLGSDMLILVVISCMVVLHTLLMWLRPLHPHL